MLRPYLIAPRGDPCLSRPLSITPPFFAWAGAMMQRDLTYHLSRLERGTTPEHLAHIRRWTERWKRRAG